MDVLCGGEGGLGHHLVEAGDGVLSRLPQALVHGDLPQGLWQVHRIDGRGTGHAVGVGQFGQIDEVLPRWLPRVAGLHVHDHEHHAAADDGPVLGWREGECPGAPAFIDQRFGEVHPVSLDRDALLPGQQLQDPFVRNEQADLFGQAEGLLVHDSNLIVPEAPAQSAGDFFRHSYPP